MSKNYPPPPWAERDGPELRRFLTRRLRCADSAADLTQEAYLRMCATARNTAVENPQAFLFHAAAKRLGI